MKTVAICLMSVYFGFLCGEISGKGFLNKDKRLMFTGLALLVMYLVRPLLD